MTSQFHQLESRQVRHLALRWLTIPLMLMLASGCGGESAAPQSGRNEKSTSAQDTPRPGGSAAAAARSRSSEKPKSRIAADLDGPTEVAGRSQNRTIFEDVALASGIDFTYLNGATGRSSMVEVTGGGCGWIDYDGDGWFDLYLPQGGDSTAGPSLDQPSDRLFRNQGDGRFQDVTAHIGIDERNYGQGVAVGDFDNDGFDDLFVTNVGRSALYCNQGDGTFVETAGHTFGAESVWCTSAAWGDVDRDGDLDLYVTRYVQYDPLNPLICRHKSGRVGTCHPREVLPEADEFYRNMGDGTFKPVARESGLFGPENRALGVVIADLDNDGWPDIFVANDTTENFLFINQRDGTFIEQAQLLGCAVNVHGNPQANMGIAVGDYDGNGYLDLYITHFNKEWDTLYQNLGPAGFHDVTAAARLATASLNTLGFGTVMADFDLDGLNELLVANGHIYDLRDEGIDFEMKSQLFSWNGTTWDDCSSTAGEFFQRRVLGRGLATCDYDGDGDLDAVLVSQNSPTALLRNDSPRGHWLKLRFRGRSDNRRGIGARVVVRSNSGTWMQELAGGTSYCAAHEPVLIFGMGEEAGPFALTVHWPDGTTQELTAVSADQSLVIAQPVPLSP